jgi:tetratricopeptide (TPR) repeat protein
MLESIREFAQQHLLQSGEAEKITRRYARYYLTLAWQAESELQGATQHIWHKQIDEDLDNYRMVMDWAIKQGESEAALHITLALWRFWWTHGYWSEGFQWLRAAMAGRGDIPDVLKARALTQCGWYYRNLGDFPQAIATLQKSLDIWHQIDNPTGIAIALSNMGACLLRQGNIQEAIAYLEEALKLAKLQGDTVTTYLTLENLGHVASKEGDIKKGSELYNEALILAEEKNDDDQVAKLLSNLGDNFVIAGDLQRAEEYFSRSAVICKKHGNYIVGAYVSGNRSIIAIKEGNYSKAFDLLVEATLVLKETGDKENTILCLEPFAYIAMELGDPSRAIRLFGASETLRISAGVTRDQQMQVDYEGDVEKLSSQLGEAAFKVAWEEGSKMSLEQAVRYAVQR